MSSPPDQLTLPRCCHAEPCTEFISVTCAELVSVLFQHLSLNQLINQSTNNKPQTINHKLSLMHLINIFNFQTSSLQDLEDYLFRKDSLRYEITIPKKEFDIKQPDFTKWQYYMAAYAGNRLSLVASSFAYTVPCPFRSDPFRFEVEHTDHKKLAFALYMITKGYYIGRDEVNYFQNEALRHFSNCFMGKSNSACWGLLHIANKDFPKVNH